MRTRIKDYVLGLSDIAGKVWFSDTASRGLVSLLPSNKTMLKLTPVALMKAIKNPVELRGFENCHIRDAAALCQYFAWLEKNVPSGQVKNIKLLEKKRKKKEEENKREKYTKKTITDYPKKSQTKNKRNRKKRICIPKLK